jgi:hypothetical protein
LRCWFVHCCVWIKGDFKVIVVHSSCFQQ